MLASRPSPERPMPEGGAGFPRAPVFTAEALDHLDAVGDLGTVWWKPNRGLLDVIVVVAMLIGLPIAYGTSDQRLAALGGLSGADFLPPCAGSLCLFYFVRREKGGPSSRIRLALACVLASFAIACAAPGRVRALLLGGAVLFGPDMGLLLPGAAPVLFGLITCGCLCVFALACRSPSLPRFSRLARKLLMAALALAATLATLSLVARLIEPRVPIEVYVDRLPGRLVVHERMPRTTEEERRVLLEALRAGPVAAPGRRARFREQAWEAIIRIDASRDLLFVEEALTHSWRVYDRELRPRALAVGELAAALSVPIAWVWPVVAAVAFALVMLRLRTPAHALLARRADWREQESDDGFVEVVVVGPAGGSYRTRGVRATLTIRTSISELEARCHEAIASKDATTLAVLALATAPLAGAVMVGFR